MKLVLALALLGSIALFSGCGSRNCGTSACSYPSYSSRSYYPTVATVPAPAPLAAPDCTGNFCPAPAPL